MNQLRLMITACALPALMVTLAACGSGRGTATPAATVAATTTPRASPSPPGPPAGTPTGQPGATPSPGATVTGDSGIEGMVLAGPTCPVERPDSPCPDRPVAIRIAVFTATHAMPMEPVTTFTSGDDGRFRLALPAGSYTLERSCGPQNCAPFPTLAPTQVQVEPGRFTRITLHADTGIR